MSTTLYHFTCDHGREALGDAGTLLPPRVHAPRAVARLHQLAGGGSTADWLLDLVWLTDLGTPDREGLGLTSRQLVSCDRTQYRYRVTDDADSVARPYLEVWRGLLPREDHLELTSGLARPGHWWVAKWPVPVEYAPIR